MSLHDELKALADKYEPSFIEVPAPTVQGPPQSFAEALGRERNFLHYNDGTPRWTEKVDQDNANAQVKKDIAANPKADADLVEFMSRAKLLNTFNLKAAETINAKPTTAIQRRTPAPRAATRGWSRFNPVAMSAPTANSQARVKVLRYAMVGSALLCQIDQASEATKTSPKTSRARRTEPFAAPQRPSVKTKTGQTR